MKTLKNTLLLAIMFVAIQVSAQTDKATTIRLIEEKNFTFNATSAIPMANNDLNKILSQMPGGNSGGNIQLNSSQYQLVVTKDSLDAFLPYYGRAYTANMNPNDSGIKFKTKSFSYKADKKKKGNWLISIKPKDAKDVESMTLSIGESGYATLNVNSNNRQSITFNGYISEPKPAKE